MAIQAGTTARASDISGVVDPIRCSVYDSTGVTVTNSVDTLLTWDSDSYDTGNMHSTSSNTSRITFSEDGLYSVLIVLSYPNATYTAQNITARLNGVTGLRIMNFQTIRVPVWPFERVFSAGDYLEFLALQTSGANRQLVSGSMATYLTVRKVANA